MKTVLLIGLLLLVLTCTVLLAAVSYLMFDEVRETWQRNQKRKMAINRMEEFLSNDKDSL